MPRYVIVLGPWSSGTTAVAGALDKLGAYTCPPHHRTPDPRTPTSFEPDDLRAIFAEYVHEPQLGIAGDGVKMAQDIMNWLERTVPEEHKDGIVAIKHPLFALMVPNLISMLRPRFIVVRRPYADIERTRVRRQWPHIYGYLGARILYGRIYADLVGYDVNFLDVFYPGVLAKPEREIDRLAEFAGLDLDGKLRSAAVDFVRR
jgi:hypothetical protein